MTVGIDDVMDNLNAEDFEQPYIENVLLPQAKSYLNVFVNRSYEDMTNDEQASFDRSLIMLIADWYTHRDGGGRNAGSTKYSGLNTVIDSIRYPGLGTAEDNK